MIAWEQEDVMLNYYACRTSQEVIEEVWESYASIESTDTICSRQTLPDR